MKRWYLRRDELKQCFKIFKDIYTEDQIYLEKEKLYEAKLKIENKYGC